MLVELIVRQKFNSVFRAPSFLAIADVDDVLDKVPLQLTSLEALL